MVKLTRRQEDAAPGAPRDGRAAEAEESVAVPTYCAPYWARRAGPAPVQEFPRDSSLQAKAVTPGCSFVKIALVIRDQA